jgi:long-chain acyl-CoA synthetase
MKTMADLVSHARMWGDRTALSCMQGGTRLEISFTELCDDIEAFGRGFVELGLKKGDRVAVFSSNNTNWLPLTLGMNLAGVINVPRGENVHEDDMAYIVEHSGAVLAIVEKGTVLAKLDRRRHANLRAVYSIDPIESISGIGKIRELGRGSARDLEAVGPDDIASIIYTSGTTGRPKGVMLSHHNILSNIAALYERVPVTTEDLAVSALPAWHVFEWAAKLFWMLAGTECFYSKIVDLPQTFEQQRPTMMPSVPRIWEAFYKRVMRNINREPAVKRAFIKTLMALAVDYARRRRFDPVRLVEAPFHRLIDRRAFEPMRLKIGGRLRYALSGGGKLPHYLDDFFHAAGIEILEGYGLTETSPIVAARTPGAGELYTVGKPLDGVQVRIVDPATNRELPEDEEGLILVRGPNVMKGYYLDEEETARVIRDGWFDTGDKGIMDRRGRLAITGRYKDTIVLDNGENINPSSLEEELLKSPFIASAFIFDQKNRYLDALIVPNFENLREHCKHNNIPYDEGDVSRSLGHAQLRQLFNREIKKLIGRNPNFKPFETVRHFDLLSEQFKIGRELTETLKFKRERVLELHRERILSMSRRMP